MHKLYLMSIAALCLVSACNKDDDQIDGDSTMCRITQMRVLSSAVTSPTTYSYNADGNPTIIMQEGSSSVTQFTYTDTSYSQTLTQNGNVVYSVGGKFDNVNKRAVTFTTQIGTEYLSYDNEGFITQRLLKKTMGGEDTTKYEIVAGDVAKGFFTSTDGSKYIITYEYYSTERVGPLFAGGELYTGKLNKHLLKKATIDYILPTPYSKFTEYQYEFDAEGHAIKVSNNDGSGTPVVYENTFTCE